MWDELSDWLFMLLPVRVQVGCLLLAFAAIVGFCGWAWSAGWLEG